jgi:cation:H+ antiporter
VSDPVLGAIFAAAAVASLSASWGLVSSLERIGARVGLSEALLGMLAALAADAPEITAAVTALIRGEDRIGAGVVLGSNVFNIAALIGLAGIVAGYIALHRRVVELGGAVAVWIALIALLLVVGAVTPLAALLLGLAVFVPYVLVLGMSGERIERLPLARSWTGWLRAAITEEEQELEPAIHPQPGTRRDALLVGVTILIVVGASIAMERSGSRLGARHGVPEIVIGGIVLAAVTSLPNAVAGVYLALRGRASAVLSTALNSNAINVLAGLLIPTTFVGIGAASAQTTFVASAALAMTLLALGFAYSRRGLARAEGLALVVAYLAFAAVLILSAG